MAVPSVPHVRRRMGVAQTARDANRKSSAARGARGCGCAVAAAGLRFYQQWPNGHAFSVDSDVDRDTEGTRAGVNGPADRQ